MRHPLCGDGVAWGECTAWRVVGWMLATLLFTCAWWIGLWDLHVVATWDVGSIAFYFLVAAGIYLVAYAVLSWVTVGVNAVLGQANGIAQWSAQNTVIVPMAVATSVAAGFIRVAWVQYLALAVQIAGWVGYFVFLQSALAG